MDQAPGKSPMLRVNGEPRGWSGVPGATLLEVLRDELGLTGTKSGCDRGECGACTVLLDGAPVLACMTMAMLADGAIETIEGVAQEALPLREAFADLGGFQCGFCTSGQIVSALALARRGVQGKGEEAERAVRRHMQGNICRCTGYVGIVDAVLRVLDREAGR